MFDNLDSKKMSWLIILAITIMVITSAFYYFIFIYHKSGTLIIYTDYPDGIYLVDNKKIEEKFVTKGDKYTLKVNLPVGNHNLKITSLNDIEVYRKNFQIKNDETETINIVISSSKNQDLLLEGE